VLGIRLVVTPVAIAFAVLFAVAAGYGSTAVEGTLLAGIGYLLANVSRTVTLPLLADLRFVAVAATELAYPVVLVAAIVPLVAVGAGLLPFLAIHLAAGFAMLGLAVALVGRGMLAPPRLAWREWRAILLEVAPMGVAIIMSVLYLRALVVIASLATSGFQTGLFATSYRIVEVALGIPGVMVNAAFPILARAGSDDEARLAYALQRLVEVSVLIVGVVVLVLVVGATSIIRIVGGDAYEQAAPVLRIQSFALLGAFLTAVWTFGLVALRRQSALILTNAIALVTIVVLGSTLIPYWGAKGAAAAATAGEAVLAVATLLMLVRGRPALRPHIAFGVKILASAAAGAAFLAVPGLPPLATAAAAVLTYSLVAWKLGAVPADAIDALVRRGPRI
jgi:O-antigen/teichoic acid export membrane protein